jgi:glutathione S-transferase
MSLADLTAAAQLSVADYLGGIDWNGHDQARDWYAVFKSRRASARCSPNAWT